MRIPLFARLALLCAAACGACPAALANYQVVTIPAIPGTANAVVAGINNAGQVVGAFNAADRTPLANFLYTPGVGVTNIERTGPPSAAAFEGSVVKAINSSGQILLASGLLYSPGLPPQDLALAIRAAYPLEPDIRFVSLNDGGMVSGTSAYPVIGGIPPNFNYSQHIFRYTPGSSAGVITVAGTNTPRSFPEGPFVMDDAGDVIYSVGFPPASATVFTAAGLTVYTGCRHDGNGWATAINNSGQIGGGWGRMSAFPEICTLDPNTFQGITTELVDESDTSNVGFVSGLNDKGDAVGWRNGFYSGTPTLFTGGQIIDVNTLFPSGSGWVATTADRINDAGQIAGTGTLNGVPAAFVLIPAPSATYSVKSLCQSCTAILLSDSGFAVSRETSSSPRFLVSSPRGPDTEIMVAASIQQINDVGTIAGSDLSNHAFIATSPYGQLDNLNPVFGWSSGTALGINDGNDVIGFGNPASFGPAFGSLRVSNLYQINNPGQITGSYLDASNQTHSFLYTPGTGIAELAGQPIALSNTGHVLVSSVSGAFSVIKPDGTLALPSGFTWRALNDRDEIVGDSNDHSLSNRAAYYSLESGLIILTASGSPGLSLTSAVAINNAGAILANASSATLPSPIAVLLTPGSGSTALSRDESTIRTRSLTRGAPSLSAERKPESVARSLNALPVGPDLSGAPR